MSEIDGKAEIMPHPAAVTPGATFAVSGRFWRRDDNGAIVDDNVGPIDGFIATGDHHVTVPSRNHFPARAFARGRDGFWTLEVSGESLRPRLIKALAERNTLYFILLQAGVGRTVIPLTVK
ncbi:MAG: hypothetical protein ACO1Q7_02115 [Gemmatimonas sp.]